MKKLTTPVISIDSQRGSAPGQDQPPQPTPAASNKPNKWIRASFVRMFILGNGIWKIARFHHVTPTTVEAELRERLTQAGELKKAA